MLKYIIRLIWAVSGENINHIVGTKQGVIGLNFFSSFGCLSSRRQDGKDDSVLLFYPVQVQLGRIQNNILRMNQLEFKFRLDK